MAGNYLTMGSIPIAITSAKTLKDRKFDMKNAGMGSTATFAPVKSAKDKQGGLASDLHPNGTGVINVADEYPWTLSKPVDEIPYVWLNEYKCTESQIMKAASSFGAGIVDKAAGAVGAGGGVTEILSMYGPIMPKDEPTGFHYKFPYFNKTGFELSSPDWQEVGDVGSSLSKLADLAGKRGAQAKEIGGAINSLMDLSNQAQNPSYGAVDRPKVFMSHQDRAITISFTLYNTFAAWDWQKNRDLGYLLMSQNLFNKRDYVTGVPPVFYDVFIPGQYYSYASAMTNIKVDHLGNQRLINDSYIIPDAYQFELTLTELVKPSKNQFEAIVNGEANSKVVTSTQYTK